MKLYHHKDDNRKEVDSVSRRQINQRLLAGILLGSCSLALPSSPAMAGEIGARITAAVTKSDLGISVRRSVVKGAQFMDGVDGQWEQFSDRFGLGANRGKQGERPSPKVIPPLQPLDGALAAQLLQTSDDVFVTLTKTPSAALQQQIDQVTVTVAPSFARSGLQVESINAKLPRNGEEFNFLTYTHFKAYTDLILQQKIDFGTFQKAYEERMGVKVQGLLQLSQDARNELAVAGSLSDAEVRQARWTASQARLQRLNAALVQRGLVAQVDVSYDKDDLADWLDDAVSDLPFNVALDGDVTLQTQILLQEQGWRFYPNFRRYAVRQALQEALGTKRLDITDYYFDTDVSCTSVLSSSWSSLCILGTSHVFVLYA